MVCVCSMLTIGSAQAAFAGPSTGYESDMVATVAADLSIYADEDENSEVVAMAEKGESYDVVGKADDSWIKVAAGEMEGYLKVQSSVMLSKAEEAAAVADAFVAEQSNLSTREQLVNYALQFVGGRYKFGGSDPHTGVDCSGFTKYVMQHGAGVSLNRSSTSQSKQGTAIGEAINLATRSFTPQEGVGRAIIVITDGENHEGGAVEAAKAAAEKGIQVSVLGVGMPEGAPIPVEGTNDYRRDREGNVIVTRLNEGMCQEIAKDGKGIYVRVDNSNSAQKAISQEISKMAKSDVESKIYTDFNEQFQAIAWIILLLLLAEMLILDRKNPLFKNVHLFSNKK